MQKRKITEGKSIQKIAVPLGLETALKALISERRKLEYEDIDVLEKIE